MTNILIVYYSSYGHIAAMAQAQAEGAARVPGARVSVTCRFQGEHVARIASRLAFSAAA